MRTATILLLAGMFASACGAGTGHLVVLPPEVEKSKAPEGKYGDVHAIYLYDIGYVHYDPIDIGHTYGPDYAYTRMCKIKLLTRAAVDTYYGNILFEHYDELYNIDAHVEKKDGSIQKLGKGDYLTTILIKDAIPDRQPPIHYYRTAILFPGLDIGDTIAYKYTMRNSTLGWTFNKIDAPVLYSKFMVARPPQRTEIQPVMFDRHSLNPEKAVDKGMATGMMGYMSISRQATYDIWTARNVPSVSEEEAMPPLVDLASRVLVWQTYRKWPWSTLGETYFKWFTHYGRYPGKPGEIAKELIKDESDPRKRAKIIHDWVKKTLIIQPHASLTFVPRQIEIETIDIDELLEEKNAPPERVASLMWLMMQAVGVDATVVLTSHVDYPPILEDLQSAFQFTHPLLALSDGTLIDTTDRLCPFGMVPWGFEGRKALWVKKGSAGFKDIPASTNSDNHRNTLVTGEVEPDGNVRVDAQVKLTGQIAYAYRRLFAPKKPKERDDSIREFVTFTAEKAEVDTYEIKNLEEVDQPLEINIKYHVPKHADMMQDKMVLRVGPFNGLIDCPELQDSSFRDFYVCPYPIYENRKNAIQFPFRRQDEMTVDVKFPKGFLLQALPKGFRTRQMDKGTMLGVQTSYGSEGGKNLQVVRKFTVNETFTKKSGYPQLLNMIRRYKAQKDTLITLELPKLD